MAKQLEKQQADMQRPTSLAGTREELELIVRQEISQFSGPIPHPDIMKGYEEVLPGSADRILSLAEKEAEHRRSLEKRTADINSRDSLLGIICATSISIGALIAGVVIVCVSKTTGGSFAGTIFGVSRISSIVIAMLKKKG